MGRFVMYDCHHYLQFGIFNGTGVFGNILFLLKLITCLCIWQRCSDVPLNVKPTVTACCSIMKWTTKKWMSQNMEHDLCMQMDGFWVTWDILYFHAKNLLSTLVVIYQKAGYEITKVFTYISQYVMQAKGYLPNFIFWESFYFDYGNVEYLKNVIWFENLVWYWRQLLCRAH
jgi:hypothetical protein